MKSGSTMHRNRVHQVCSNQVCMTYFHRIMLMSSVVTQHAYLQCISMSLCNTTFLNCLELLHGFASNFVWMFLRWTPTKFVKIRVLPLFFMELWVFLFNFGPFLIKIFLNYTIEQKSFIYGLESSQGT